MVNLRKIVISGAAGNNGFATLKRLREMGNGLVFDEIIALVISNEEEQRVYAHLRAVEESTSHHHLLWPTITQDPEKGKDAGIWINWKGINLVTLQKIYESQGKNVEEEAVKQGKDPRDLLLEKNLKIALEDAGFAKRYAPDAFYIQQGNPVDILARAVQLQYDFDPSRVLSTGPLMEWQRFTKLFTAPGFDSADEFLDERGYRFYREGYFPEITLDRATGLYVGEHGTHAVPVKESILLGGVPIEEYVLRRHGESGLEKLAEVYRLVNDEVIWMIKRTKQTPFEGPAAVTEDLLRMLLNQKGTIAGICRAAQGSYDLDDIHIGLPTFISREGIQALERDLTDETQELLYHAADHVHRMNKLADELRQGYNE